MSFRWTLVLLALLVTDIAVPIPARAEGKRTIVEVIANGTGLNKRSALNDAYRNAVQQVVGLYVDAETLVKNDALVRDKVLTTSNGFIVDSKEVASRIEDGLFRVTIRAQVESSKLLAGLTTARITIRKIDGESLFAKARTRMERSENLQQTLLKILLDLGPLLKADIEGKPDFDTSTSELVFQLKLQADLERFSLFRKRLSTFLESVCIRKVVTGVRATKGAIKHMTFPPEVMGDLYISSPSRELLWGPRLTTNKHWVLWLQTFENKSYTSLRWTGFVLDTDWRPVFQSVLRQHMPGYSDRFYSRKKDSFYHFNFSLDEDEPRHPELGRVFVSTNFRDAKKKICQFDKFELFCDSYLNGCEINDFSQSPGSEGSNLLPPAFVNYCARSIGSRSRPIDGYHGIPFRGHRGGRPEFQWSIVENSSLNLFIAPVMLTLEWDRARLVFRRFIRIERRIKIQRDELADLETVDSQVEYIKPVLQPKKSK